MQIASFEPHSSQASGLADFSIFIYIVCVAILLLVTGLAGFGGLEPRWAHTGEDGVA